MSKSTSNWALVTGASKGIGAACAVELAKAGYDIIVAYGQDDEGANRVAQACADQGVQTRTVSADISQTVEPITAVIDEVGGLAVLVNNAGITRDGLAMAMSDEDFDAVIRVNLTAQFRLARHVLRPMLRARRGRIIFISSVVGLIGNAGQANYAAAKAGVIGLAKTLSREVAKRGITVNTVAPGFISTDMTKDLNLEPFLEHIPAGRIGEPEDVAAAVAFLASPGAAYITGQVLSVNGGMAS
ncbi:3-oxoacyl-[acyl-carrier-protein] reductase [Stomatohabitans albus]|uniref:3-oxoacyl-[acyl-carrier-protein] reductase n=1 Tax=Stomatohabitans albus TaxID=3110766 RepID=UPI00300C0D94